MLYTKFIHHPELGFVQKEDFGREMSILGNFLTSEVGPVDIAFKKWAINPERTSNSGNMVFLDKVGSNIILTYDPYIFPDDIKLVLSQQDFIRIINEWEDAIKKKPQEIWIKKEGDRVWIECVNSVIDQSAS